MNHRHLLPNEIDLLIDDELGFGVAPLRAHLAECDECRERVDEARFVAESLETLPHLAPSYGFADRVMAEVPVFVPWHVAARDWVAGWIPDHRGARAAVFALASGMAGAFTIAMVWLATQTDLLVFVTGVAGERARTFVTGEARGLLSAVLGDQVLAAIQQAGVTGAAIAGGVLIAAIVATVFGLRSLALASGRRRA